MKHPLALIAALGLVAWGSSVANANDLFNANLDQVDYTSQINKCPIGWIVDASKTISGGYLDGGDSETWCNVSPPSDPLGYGFFFKPFAGDQPSGDLLTVFLYQDNPATPGTKFTLSGYAAGEANYSGFFNTNSPAPQTLFFVEFLDAGGNGLVTNEYDLVASGLPNGGPGSMTLMTTPQFTAPANTATVRAGAVIRNTYGTTLSQSFFVDAFDLESVAPPGSPVITSQPNQTTVAPGTNVTLTVGATGATSYQWQRNNSSLSDVAGHIAGSTSPTLSITSVFVQ